LFSGDRKERGRGRRRVGVFSEDRGLREFGVGNNNSKLSKMNCSPGTEN